MLDTGDVAPNATGYQTEQGVSVEGVRCWFATAERCGWL